MAAGMDGACFIKERSPSAVCQNRARDFNLLNSLTNCISGEEQPLFLLSGKMTVLCHPCGANPAPGSNINAEPQGDFRDSCLSNLNCVWCKTTASSWLDYFRN